MKVKKIAGVSFVLAAFSIFGFAEETGTQKPLVLTIDDAVKMADDNNLTIKIQKNTLDDLKNKKNFSWNSISPTLKASGNFADDFEKNTKSAGFSGAVNLGLTTNLFSNINGAKLNYENGKISYDQAVKQVELNVWKSFYGILYKKDYLELQKRSLETSKTNYEQNQEKFKNGKISELDVMTSRVNYEQKKPAVEAASIDYENDLSAFKQVLGIDINTPLELNGNLDDVLVLQGVTLPEVDQPAPDIQAAQKAVAIAKNTLLGQRFSAYGPSITGSYNIGKSMNLDTENWTTTNSLSVGVSIPLDGYLPWSTGAVSIKSAKEALETAEIRLKDAQTTQAVKTQSYMRNIQQGISQISSLKENVNLAQKTYDMTKTAYNYGKTDLLSLQNASDSVLNAQVSLKKQAKSLLETLLDMEYLLGLKLGSLGRAQVESNQSE